MSRSRNDLRDDKMSGNLRRVLVLAGNHHQYLAYLHHQDESLYAFTFAQYPEQIRGKRFDEVVRTGESWLNPLNDDWQVREIEGASR